MDEMIDVLDEYTGEKTGEVITKNEAHKTGMWHGSVHVLIINNAKTKTLLQKDAKKRNYIQIHGIYQLVAIYLLVKMILLVLKEN